MNSMKALAKELLREVQTIDDYQAAKALLLDKVGADAQLRHLAVEFAVETFLASEWRSGRSARWRQTQGDAEAPNEVAFGGGTRPVQRPRASFALRRGFAEAVLRAGGNLLMDWELGPGVRMKDATRPMLNKHAAHNEAQSEAMHYRAIWYRRVAKMLPDDTTPVKAVLREADLKREEQKAKE